MTRLSWVFHQQKIIRGKDQVSSLGGYLMVSACETARNLSAWFLQAKKYLEIS